jgi:hypothetical protein
MSLREKRILLLLSILILFSRVKTNFPTVRGWDANYCPPLIRMQTTYTVWVRCLTLATTVRGIHIDAVNTRITTIA